MCKETKNRFGANYTRISDYDNIAFECIQIIVLNLIISSYLKYKSTKEYRRQDARNSARLAVVLLVQIFDKKKPHYKQFEICLQEIVNWNNKQRSQKDCYVGMIEMEFYQSLL